VATLGGRQDYLGGRIFQPLSSSQRGLQTFTAETREQRGREPDGKRLPRGIPEGEFTSC